MSMSSGIKNWHWRSKDCRPWAASWFKAELPQVSTSKTRIVSVKDVEGDADVGMRKSKLVTIYDLKITSVWSGALADGTEISGNIVAVEVAHDMDEDEYVFETFFEDPSTWNGNKEAQALREDAHKNLADGLRSIFQAFPRAMIATHGKDLLAADAEEGNTGSNAGSGASTPAVQSSSAAQQSASSNGAKAPSEPAAKSAAASKAKASGVTTAKVRTEGEFMIVRHGCHCS